MSLINRHACISLPAPLQKVLEEMEEKSTGGQLSQERKEQTKLIDGS